MGDLHLKCHAGQSRAARLSLLDYIQYEKVSKEKYVDGITSERDMWAKMKSKLLCCISNNLDHPLETTIPCAGSWFESSRKVGLGSVSRMSRNTKSLVNKTCVTKLEACFNNPSARWPRYGVKRKSLRWYKKTGLYYLEIIYLFKTINKCQRWCCLSFSSVSGLSLSVTACFHI